MKNSTIQIASLVVVAVVLFSANLGGYDLWPADEPRYAEVSREMLDSGNYLAPHVNGRPYREKPPLLFWAISAASIIPGEVTETSARIPSVLAALVVLVCTYLLASGLYGRQTALWSVIILATFSRFWWEARTAQIDMLLTACMTFAILMFWKWRDGHRALFLLFFYLAIGLGVYAKGPPAIVFPALLIITFYWRDGENRKKTRWVFGLVFVAAFIALWLIPARMSVGAETEAAVQLDIGGNLFRQTVGRFLLGVSHANPPWYYLVEALPLDLMPWTLFVPFTILYVWRKRRDDEAIRFLLAWSMPALLFFSISIGKRALYLLPIYPAIAILVARSVLDLVGREPTAWRKRTAMAWAAFLFLISATPFVLRFTDYRDVQSAALTGLGALAAVFGGYVVFGVVKNAGASLHKVIAIQIAVLYLAVAFIVFPAINPYKSAREFCEPVARLTAEGTPFNLYSVGFSREEYVFYSRRLHTPLLTELVPLERPDGFESTSVAELQVSFRKSISDAAEKVPIDSLASITSVELEALNTAIRAASEDLDYPQELLDAAQDGLKHALDALSEESLGGEPSVIYIKDEDLRWLLSVAPVLGEYRVLREASVGSRDVLLLANGAGEALLKPYLRRATVPTRD
jgi:4-amino-4-deoxy-L-arabinose transferase-like glycosyltransferase